eukprot:s1772_g7.t1
MAVPPAPTLGDAILVFKPKWLPNILSGQKVAEVRHQKHPTGAFWLAAEKMIEGWGRVVSQELVTDDSRWRDLVPKHLWSRDTKPFAKTWVHSLDDVQRVTPIPFLWKQGCIGRARYAPIASSYSAFSSSAPVVSPQSEPMSSNSAYFSSVPVVAPQAELLPGDANRVHRYKRTRKRRHDSRTVEQVNPVALKRPRIEKAHAGQQKPFAANCRGHTSDPTFSPASGRFS